MTTRTPEEHENTDPKKRGELPKDDPRRDQRRDERLNEPFDPNDPNDPNHVDPKNDPQYGHKHDPDRLPSSALPPQERHDRDIEDLKKAGHDFKGPVVEKDDNANPDDPQLRTVTVEDTPTRRDDGLDVPPVPGTAAAEKAARHPKE